jgi:putative tricarboxylic transport membrane protein
LVIFFLRRRLSGVGRQKEHGEAVERRDRKIGIDRVSGVIVLLIGLAIVWQASLLRLGNFRVPGPGLYPLLLGLVTILLSLFLILPPGTTKKEGNPLHRGTIKRVAGVYAVMLLYLAILEYVGFLIATFLLVLFLFAVVGRGSVKAAALRAFFVTVFAYLLFDVVLKSQLPKGILGI